MIPPLAEALRPQTLAEFIGQDHLLGEGGILKPLIEEDRFHSLIFHGPPGTGKTSLAHLIAKESGHHIHCLSATESGVKELRQTIERSQIRRAHGEPGLLLFLDEIHRLARNQQDVLLQAIEAGELKMIGATTENPSFALNRALLSRSLTFPLYPLDPKALTTLAQKGLKTRSLSAPPSLLAWLSKQSQGDGRRLLTLIDALPATIPPDWESSELKQQLVQSFGHYDKNQDSHYDYASALIKTIRASDPDAALYYLAQMILGGEDPLFIMRRLCIAASEDIGNANPTACLMAASCQQMLLQVGMPEGRIILSQLTTYLAASPKSNQAYLAIDRALEMVKRTGPKPPPLTLRNAPTSWMKDQGYGKDYVYAHDDPLKAAAMNYFPEGVPAESFYRPSDHGVERQLKENLKRLRPSAEDRS